MATTELSKIKEKLAALEAEINKQRAIEREVNAHRAVPQEEDHKKMIETILESFLSQILSMYLEEDGKKALLKPESTILMERECNPKEGEGQEKKQTLKGNPTTSSKIVTISEPQKAKERRTASSTGPQTPKAKKAAQEAKKRVPKIEAVTIQPPSKGETYTEVLNKAKAMVDLNSLQITVVNTRKTKEGGILLEVKEKEKADVLAQKLREADVGKIRRRTDGTEHRDYKRRTYKRSSEGVPWTGNTECENYLEDRQSREPSECCQN